MYTRVCMCMCMYVYVYIYIYIRAGLCKPNSYTLRRDQKMVPRSKFEKHV